MPSKQRKHGRDRARAQEKARRARAMEAHNRSLLISNAHRVYGCYANADWQDDGIASILMARQVGLGHVSIAAFLVDRWCMGLKDAWCLLDAGISEFEERVAELDARLGMVAMKLDTARHLVYGGVALAKELGFRLPRRWERAALVLGPLAAGVTPDPSLFRRKGRLVLMTNMTDLRARLMGTSVEKFLSRTDIDIELGDEDFTLVDAEADEYYEAADRFTEHFTKEVADWCSARGNTPSPLVAAAVRAVMEAAEEQVELMEDDDELPDPSVLVTHVDRPEELLASWFPEQTSEARMALGQVMQFVCSLPDQEAFFARLVESKGLDSGPADGDDSDRADILFPAPSEARD